MGDECSPKGENSCRKKKTLACLLGSIFILFLALEIWISSGSELSPGNYGRYLDAIWAEDILLSGHLRNTPFPTDPSLFSNANSYRFNLVPAETIAIVNQLTGFPVTEIQMMPLFGIVFFFSAVLVARAIYRGSTQGAILAVLLTFFLAYTNNGIAAEVSRIVLSYSLFFLFLYSFFRSKDSCRLRYAIMQVLFLLFFILAYSSYSVSLVPMVFVMCVSEVARTKRMKQLYLFGAYSVGVLLYYLIMTDFMAGGIGKFGQVLSEGFRFSFLLRTPGIWPTERAYVPIYSWFDWFFLLFPVLVIGILLSLATFRYSIPNVRKRRITNHDELLGSFVVFLLFVVVFNGFFVFATAGLDFIVVFFWLAPVLSVLPLLNRFGESCSRKVLPGATSTVSGLRSVNRYSRNAFRGGNLAAAIIVCIILVIGVIGQFNYSALDQREGERVSVAEVQAASWLGGLHLTIVSDLHFTSTYVTIGSINAAHFLPMGVDMIDELYYDVNVSFMISHGIDAFVVTESMRTHYLTHFIGTRTVPNADLCLMLSAQSNLIFSNGEVDIFRFLP